MTHQTFGPNAGYATMPDRSRAAAAEAIRRASYCVDRATGRHKLADATLFVAAALRAAMGLEYATELEAIAEATGLPRSRLAVLPIRTDARLREFEWAIRGPRQEVIEHGR
jgi:hypothetical protein